MIAVTTAVPAVLLAARATGVPVLLYAGETVPLGPGVGRAVAGRVLLRVARSHASAILCCSHAVARQFEGHGAPPVTIAYPPIGEGYAGGDRDATRAALGVPHGASCLVTAGAISRGRGQDVALRAFALIRERADARLVIAGAPHPRAIDRAYRRELDELAERLGVADGVVFTGAFERMRDLYAAADVVVSPARHEAFGGVSAEALVARRPVVATEVGGVPEVLRDGVDGLLVPADDPEALADAVQRVLADPELARRLVSAGAARVGERFSARQSLEAFECALAGMHGHLQKGDFRRIA